MRARRKSFIERSILGALSFFKEFIYSDEYAAKRGFLQSLDPRMGVVTALSFILLILFAKHILLIALIYVICLVLAWSSRISLRFFLMRTWFFIPLFSLFIAIPALFSVFSPGKELFVFHPFGQRLIVTEQGFYGALIFIIRVAASVSVSVLLMLTTKHSHLLKSLRIFKVPQVFVMTLGMCYRYIYLFVIVMENAYMAMKSRCGIRIGNREGQKIVAWNMASLWHKSYHLHHEVYNAMVSRGYNGDESHLLDEFKFRARDAVWGFCIFCFSLFMLYLNYAVLKSR